MNNTTEELLTHLKFSASALEAKRPHTGQEATKAKGLTEACLHQEPKQTYINSSHTKIKHCL